MKSQPQYLIEVGHAYGGAPTEVGLLGSLTGLCAGPVTGAVGEEHADEEVFGTVPPEGPLR